jgi:hypothetical protein
MFIYLIKEDVLFTFSQWKDIQDFGTKDKIQAQIAFMVYMELCEGTVLTTVVMENKSL